MKAKLEVRKADPREYIRLQQQADIIEMELSKVRFQLADSSKVRPRDASMSPVVDALNYPLNCLGLYI